MDILHCVFVHTSFLVELSEVLYNNVAIATFFSYKKYWAVIERVRFCAILVSTSQLLIISRKFWEHPVFWISVGKIICYLPIVLGESKVVLEPSKIVFSNAVILEMFQQSVFEFSFVMEWHFDINMLYVMFHFSSVCS
jgi:hypothetical protein